MPHSLVDLALQEGFEAAEALLERRAATVGGGREWPGVATVDGKARMLLVTKCIATSSEDATNVARCLTNSSKAPY